MKQGSPTIIGARRAETRLFLCDCALSATLVLFLSAINTWESPWIDGPILAFWAMIPQAVARFFRSRPWPKSSATSFVICLSIVGFAIGVGATGWNYISAGIDLNLGMGQEVAIILLTSWASAFFLFQVQTYRLHDALSFGALSIGLVDGRPWGLFWGLTFVSIFFLAAPIRHQLFDIHAYTARPQLQLWHGAKMMIGIFLVSIIVFVGGEATTRTLLGEKDSAWGQLAPPADTSRLIGWSTEFKLSDLGKARKSLEPLFAFQARSRGIELRPPLRPKTNKNTLWRVQILDKVRHDGSTWETARKTRFEVSNKRVFIRREPSLIVNTQYVMERLSPKTALFPIRYDAITAKLLTSEAKDVTIGHNWSGEVALFAENKPSQIEGDKIELGLSRNALRKGKGIGARRDHPLDLHTELPNRKNIGFDLKELSSSIFSDADSLGVKLRKLELFYAKNFIYDTTTTWAERRRRGDTQLKNFLLSSRVGDCTYFATSACLLLRASGVPARLAKGFLGHTWDGAQQRYIITEGSAHVWAEYYIEGQGWFPYDATAFVDDRSVMGQENEATTKKTGAQGHSKSRSSSDKKRGVSRLFGLVSDAYNQDRAIMVLFGSIGLIFFIAFLKRPRVAPRKSRGSRPETITTRGTQIRNTPPLSAQTADSPREIVIARYAQWQEHLSRWRNQRAPEETPFEHAKRLATDYAKHQDPLRDVAKIFCDAFFGNKEISPDRLREFETHLRSLNNRLK